MYKFYEEYLLHTRSAKCAKMRKKGPFWQDNALFALEAKINILKIF